MRLVTVTRFDLAALRAMTTIASGHNDDLKLETADIRVWLSRSSVDDGEPFPHAVTVETLLRGEWHNVDRYCAACGDDRMHVTCARAETLPAPACEP